MTESRTYCTPAAWIELFRPTGCRVSVIQESANRKSLTVVLVDSLQPANIVLFNCRLNERHSIKNQKSFKSASLSVAAVATTSPSNNDLIDSDNIIILKRRRQQQQQLQQQQQANKTIIIQTGRTPYMSVGHDMDIELVRHRSALSVVLPRCRCNWRALADYCARKILWVNELLKMLRRHVRQRHRCKQRNKTPIDH